ncbi:hypothetical protein BDV98DRAFT_602364 [Pterulicium gracile]|uniref:G-protein coupled receptors family 1 profile domain-containing protein n=1 Tax=Pterulicium gracile TaxID=1884261 RepID=A0A5C3QSN5_9AGAR|nr:hypothetical protein BDV98DRAFT_602364 [Pterula gracilis]
MFAGQTDLSAEAGTSNFAAIYALNALQASALTLTVLALIPALFSESVQRMKTWFALLFCSILYNISFLLIVGRQAGPRFPSLPLCLIQSGLIYAAPPFFTTAAVIFMIELHLRLTAAVNRTQVNEAIMLWSLPAVHTVIFWLAVVVRAIMLTVSRGDNDFFCNVDQRTLTLTTGASVCLIFDLMIGVEIYTIIFLWRRKLSIKAVTVRGCAFPIQLFIRTTVYTLVGGLGIILAVLLINTENNYQTLLLLPFVPLSMALVFGSHLDILKVYVS